MVVGEVAEPLLDEAMRMALADIAAGIAREEAAARLEVPQGVQGERGRLLIDMPYAQHRKHHLCFCFEGVWRSQSLGVP